LEGHRVLRFVPEAPATVSSADLAPAVTRPPTRCIALQSVSGRFWGGHCGAQVCTLAPTTQRLARRGTRTTEEMLAMTEIIEGAAAAPTAIGSHDVAPDTAHIPGAMSHHRRRRSKNGPRHSSTTAAVLAAMLVNNIPSRYGLPASLTPMRIPLALTPRQWDKLSQSLEMTSPFCRSFCRRRRLDAPRLSKGWSPRCRAGWYFASQQTPLVELLTLVQWVEMVTAVRHGGELDACRALAELRSTRNPNVYGGGRSGRLNQATKSASPVTFEAKGGGPMEGGWILLLDRTSSLHGRTSRPAAYGSPAPTVSGALASGDDDELTSQVEPTTSSQSSRHGDPSIKQAKPSASPQRMVLAPGGEPRLVSSRRSLEDPYGHVEGLTTPRPPERPSRHQILGRRSLLDHLANGRTTATTTSQPGHPGTIRARTGVPVRTDRRRVLEHGWSHTARSRSVRVDGTTSRTRPGPGPAHIADGTPGTLSLA